MSDAITTTLQSTEHAALAEQAGYLLQGLLWRSGLGVCYRASHRHLGRVVVLEMIDPNSPHYRERCDLLAWEAKVLSRVEHPGIVRLHDFGILDEQPYLVLEHPTGGRLLDRARGDNRLTLPAAVSLVRQLALAVHALHQQGFVHRNLRPACVWMMADGSFRIADLAIAVSLEDRSTPVRRAGTRPYMAPEQVEGRDVSPATDIHALGLILFELLTGKLPFEAGGTQPESLTRLRPDAPPWLEGVCRRCLESDPRRRFASAEALARTLEHGLPLGDQATFPYEILLRFINNELDGATRAQVQRQLASDARWRAHHESVRHLKLERLAAQQDARELSGFTRDRATPTCLEVARGNGDLLLPLTRPGAQPPRELVQHVQQCVFCRRMSRLVQGRVLAEANHLPPGEKLLRDWLLEATYASVLEQARQRLGNGHLPATPPAAAPRETIRTPDTVAEYKVQEEEQTVIDTPVSPTRQN